MTTGEWTDAQAWERFAEIVKRGGVVAMASDVFAALQRHAQQTQFSPTAFDVEIRVSPWLAPGTICAIDPGITPDAPWRFASKQRSTAQDAPQAPDSRGQEDRE